MELAENKYPMGWGVEGDPINHRLMKERQLAEDLDPFFSNIADLVSFKGEETEMERLCRSKFEFDDGWCFNVTDRLLYGKDIIHNQGSVGSCVGAGGGIALASKAAQEILNEGDPEEPYGWFDTHPMPFTGYHYGAGRCKNLWDGEEFRGSNNRGDGSYCSVQIWAYKTTGILPCRGVADQPFPQSTNIRSWGNNKNNLLNKYLSEGQKYLMKNSVTVKSADDLLDTITVLKQPCHICSGWGFAPKGFDDKYGIMVYKRSGSWAHNMTVWGCIKIKGTWFVVIKNSWGANAHKEVGRGIPLSCFVIPLDLFSSWIRQAECMSIGELHLPKENLGWPI